MTNLSGTMLKGYDLHERIGAGGFGAVYRAIQSTVGREVAIKIILPGYANKSDFVRRFETEAQLVARLEHLHIVPLYDYWRDPNGAYIVMRYLRGGSLKDLLARGALDLETSALLLDQVASALTVAHRNDVIHRDIKPANILLDEDGNGYLADFGIAKELTVQQTSLTGPDAVIGSPDYLAPEQARADSVTPQTDIYSLGVVLYEMLTGQHPFPGKSAVERLYAHLNEPLPEIQTLDEDVSSDINDVIERATTKNPAQRFTDVMALAAAFRDAAGLSVSRIESSLVELLTPREQEVLKLIIKGKTNREIADKLTIEVSTVKSYINQIYRKLNVRSRVQAIVKAREMNLIVGGFEDGAAATTTYSRLPPPENPYKGLRAFTVADEKDFFGRARMVSKLLTKLDQDGDYNRFLAVVGPSGSGKSSLVKAGLIPALWRGEIDGSDNWYTVDFIPGNRPLDELEVALMRLATDQNLNLAEQLARDEAGLLRVSQLILPDDASELLVIIDQFEEVFTLVEDEKQREHFLSLLNTAVTDSRSRVRVLVTMRADFYDRPLHYPDFAKLMRERMETVLPLGAEELERAIVEPAKQVGVQFEEGLVSTIISEINYQPGALPLLQYALTELFETQNNRRLTHESYEEIGRAVGALATRAEEIYQELEEDGQEVARQMFLRLVTLGEGVEDTRRRVDRADLLAISFDADLIDEVIDTFATYRLLSLDHDPATRRPTVEVAHEALLREWERLREWLNESRTDIRLQQQLSNAAVQWQEASKDQSFLLRGSRLEQLEAWRQLTELALTRQERDFLDASVQLRDEEATAEAERQIREATLERRSRNTLRTLVGVMVIATIIASGLAIFALSSRVEARRNAEEFRSIALINAGQQQLSDGNPDSALAFGVEAMRIDDPPLTTQFGFRRIAGSSWIKHRFNIAETSVFDARYFSDGERIIITSLDDEGYAEVRDIETGRILNSLVYQGQPTKIAIHPSNNLVAISALEPFIKIWDLEQNTVKTIDGNTGLTFSPDGRRMATGKNGGSVVIWDTETWDPLLTFPAHYASFIPGLDFSADGRLLVTGAWDSFVHVWDSETGELLQTLDHRNISAFTDPHVWSVNFLADQKRILTGGGFGMALWDWQSGEIIWLEETQVAAQDIALSPDERTFVVGFNDPQPTAELRIVDTGRRLKTYQGHAQRVQNVDFSPDGSSVLTASNDGSVIIWPVDWEGALATHFVRSNNVVVSHPAEPIIATVGVASATEVDSTIRLVDIRTGDVIQKLTGLDGSVKTLAFTPDGQTLFSGAAGRLIAWDIASGEMKLDLKIGGSEVWAIDFTPDGQVVAIGDNDDFTIILFDADTGEQVAVLEGHQALITTIVFSPDGQYIYSGDRGGTLFKWDWQAREIVMQMAGHPVAIYALDISADGSQLLSGSVDASAILWDTTSGESRLTLNGHSNTLMDAVFSPDNDTIMTASIDGTIFLWDAQTGEHLRTYVAATQAFWTRAAFSADGQTIISSTNDVLTIWEAEPLSEGLLEWITNNRHIPDFSCEQREQYLIEPLCSPDSNDDQDAVPLDQEVGSLPFIVLVSLMGVSAVGLVIAKRRLKP